MFSNNTISFFIFLKIVNILFYVYISANKADTR